ncbi:MAG: hypothetical protein ABUK01_15335 [Leptospirales bacterium]
MKKLVGAFIITTIAIMGCTNNFDQVVTGYDETVTETADEETVWSNITNIGSGIDTDLDGVPDAIDINNDGVADIVLLDTVGTSRRADINSDLTADFYMNIDNLGNVTFSTAINGGGSPVIIKYDINNVPFGYDNTGDGVADFNLTGVAINYYTVGGSITTLGANMIISLKVNGVHAENLLLTSGPANYVFTTNLDDNSSYEVAIVSYPTGQNCLLSNEVGIIATANATTANVKCGVYEDTLDVATVTSLFGTPLDSDFDGVIDSIDIDYDGVFNANVDMAITGNTGDGVGLTIDIDGTAGTTEMYLCQNAVGVFVLQSTAGCGGTNYQIIRDAGVPIGYDSDADGLANVDLNNNALFTITVTITWGGTETWVTVERKINGFNAGAVIVMMTNPLATYTFPITYPSGTLYDLKRKADSGIGTGCAVDNVALLPRVLTANVTENITCN